MAETKARKQLLENHKIIFKNSENLIILSIQTQTNQKKHKLSM